MGSYLTYITGIATLLGLVLQLKDVFPTHREARRGILYVCFGVFIGSLVGAINSIDIKLSDDYGIVSLVLISVLVVVALSLIVMTFMAFNTNDAQQRRDLFNSIGPGIFVFFIMLFAIALSTSSIQKDERYSIGEEMAMAKHNLDKKNCERAISLYRSSVVDLNQGDPRKVKVKKIIEKAQKDMADGI